MRICRLWIANFWGIKSLDWTVPIDQRLVALVGPGDSGKSTILDAVHLLLGDRLNVPFTDTDFYGASVDVLGFAQRNVSKRVRGEMPFRIDELLAISRHMGITLAQLLGEEIVNEKNPQPVAGGSSFSVAGEGFEPSTSGL